MARQILVVDQSNSMRRIIKTMILAEINDADVAEAQDVDEAMDRLQGKSFHVVLFSRESSTADWLAYVRKQSAEACLEKTAFVVFTSSKQKKLPEEFRANGVKEQIAVPCSPQQLGETINRVCSIFTLRSGRRYSLPGATAILEQGASSTTAELVNFSDGGMLCELAQVGTYSWNAPAMVTLNLPLDGDKLVATGLFSVSTRLTVSESYADHTPKRVRIALRFLAVPVETRKVLDQAFAFIEKQEGMFE
ncbi:MAG: hypothetical protein ACOY8P_13205 [Thermodesulfobacteriota bacterium]